MNTFGKKIESIRISSRLTVKEVSEKVGIPQSRLKEMEMDVRIPTDGQVERIEQFFNLPAGELAKFVK